MREPAARASKERQPSQKSHNLARQCAALAVHSQKTHITPGRAPAHPRPQRDIGFLTMTDKAIALENLHLSLGRGPARLHILKGIDLEIARGEAVGIVGPSGSGKSTLLMIMAGLERPDSRHASSSTGPISAGSTRTLSPASAAAHIGIVFQIFPPRADHDGARERRLAAGARRRRRTPSTAR